MSKVINTEVVDEITSIEKNSKENLTLEALTFLVYTNKIDKVEKDLRKEFKTLNDRQDDVQYLHQVQKAINKATDDKGSLNTTDSLELQELLKEASEKFGIDIPVNKRKFTAQERERLVENIKLTIDDKNVQNELQMQTVNRLNNDRQEIFQLIRSILKPLHDAKIHHAQGIAGR
ncbi:hypothetical protein N9Y92_01525 [Chlamydiales bacterium]|nr:hypothetical protein [Chlamydiales bacterium]